MNVIVQPFVDGFMESMRLAKILISSPVIAAVAVGCAVWAASHHRVFRTRDAISALREAAAKR